MRRVELIRFGGLEVVESPLAAACGAFQAGNRLYVGNAREFYQRIRFAGVCARCGELVRNLPRHAQACADLGGEG